MTKAQERALRKIQRMLSPTLIDASPQVVEALADPNLKIYLDSWVRPLVDALVSGASADYLRRIT